MKVTLINYTKDAEDVLIFTKSTRLSMTPDGLQRIKSMSQEQKLAELDYMANTIPSSWEFVDYIFAVEGVSRAYTHQQVRTRSASYAQQSMRVVDAGDFEYIFTERNKEDPKAMETISDAMEGVSRAYKELLDMGQATEDARGVLPTNIATNIVCKFNLRTFSQLVQSRSGGRTQGEYQQVVRAMAEEVLRVHPWADKFLYPAGKNFFDEIEAFADREYGGNLLKKGELLKIVDKMRASR